MTLTVQFSILKEKKFDYPFRIFISGSSQSGKTFFTGQLLQSSVFQNVFSHVIYYHPDYLSECPVEWHKTLSEPVSYQTGVPTLDDLRSLEKDTCVILDDLYEECVNAQSIDYLFRVLSGKNNLSVIIMSQRYFAQGKYSMNIRNNCNFTVLMRNVDGNINFRIASLMSLQKPIKKAIEEVFPDNYWPFIFIDSSPKGQVSKLRVYTNIFDKYQEVYSDDGMKAFVISEKDFLKHFKLSTERLAISKYENEKKRDTKSGNSINQKRASLSERAKQIRYRRKIKDVIQRS